MHLEITLTRSGVRLAVSLLAVTLFMYLPNPAFAAEVRSGDAIVVPAGETINDDLYAFG